MSLRKRVHYDERDSPYDPDNEEDVDNDEKKQQHRTSKKQKIQSDKPPSLRVQLNALKVPVLKDILRFNHQNPFGNKSELISRILYLVKHGGYPRCPRCKFGRLKRRLHRRKDESKFYCPGYPSGFREGDSFIRCNYSTDACEKETFVFYESLNLIV